MIPGDDKTLLRGLADQASSAIKNAELFEQVSKGRERQRKLAKSLVDIQEAERRQFARELHDRLGQALTGLQFMLESVKKQIKDTPRPELDEIQKYVAEIMEQTREMALNLRPSMLDDLGLVPTLQWHFDRYSNQTGIQINFQGDDSLKRLPMEIETTAYRIIQEALTNVARYAQVQEVFVGLRMEAKTLALEVSDSGRGFDPSADLDKPAFGLGGMRERASLAGGFLTVTSRPDHGTQIRATLPLDGKNFERRKSDRNGPSGR